jgi:predicted nucleic acid-binding protein
VVTNGAGRQLPAPLFIRSAVSLTPDPQVADASRIHGPRQITDLYLLALAVRHDGRFVTFDRSVALDAIHGAQPRHLFLL